MPLSLIVKITFNKTWYKLPVIVKNHYIKKYLRMIKNVFRFIRLFKMITFNFLCSSLGNDEFQIVNTPPFAESITEGDVRWEKGKD